MAVNGVREQPHSEHRINPPESSQNLWAAREGSRLPSLNLALAASTCSLFKPASGTGTAIHSSEPLIRSFVRLR